MMRPMVLGHQPEHRRWDMTRRPRPAVCGLDGQGQVIEGDVVGPADLQRLARVERVGDGAIDEAATSTTDTRLTGLSPRPNTSGRPDLAAVRRSRSTHSSMNAVARTTVVGTPLAAAWRSAACFIRNSSIGLSGAAPTTDINTRSAPAAPAALTRLALPSRSTVAGEMPRGPTKPCTAETTTSQPATAAAAAAGSRTSPMATSHGGGTVRDAFGVAGEDTDGDAAVGEPVDEKRSKPAGAAGHEDHDGRLPPSWRLRNWSTPSPPSWTGSR